MTLLVRRCSLALLVVLALEVLVCAGHGTPWRGEWNWMLDHLVGSTVLTGPAVGALAAGLSSDERRRSTLNDGAARGWQVPLRAAIAAALTGLAGFVLGLLAGVVATITVPHGGPFAAWFLAIVPLLLATYAVLGALAGHLWPHRITVVLTAPALFLLGTLASLGIGPNVLRQGPTTGSLAGTTWNPSVVSRQGLCLLGAIVLAAAVPPVLLWVRPVLARTVAGLGALLLLVGLATLQLGGDERLQVSAERPTDCAGHAPRLCLSPSHRRSLVPVQRQLRRVGAVLTEAGAQVPSTYLEELPAYHGRLDSGLLILPAHANVARFGLFAASNAIALPAPCPAWSAETAPPEVAFEAQGLIASWIMSRLSHDPPPTYSPQAGVWLRRAPAAAQRAWVAAAFDDLRRCRLGEIRMPWHG